MLMDCSWITVFTLTSLHVKKCKAYWFHKDNLQRKNLLKSKQQKLNFLMNYISKKGPKITLGRQRLHSLVLLQPFICTVEFTLYKYFQLKLSSDTEFLKLNQNRREQKQAQSVFCYWGTYCYYALEINKPLKQVKGKAYTHDHDRQIQQGLSQI